MKTQFQSVLAWAVSIALAAPAPVFAGNGQGAAETGKADDGQVTGSCVMRNGPRDANGKITRVCMEEGKDRRAEMRRIASVESKPANGVDSGKEDEPKGISARDSVAQSTFTNKSQSNRNIADDDDFIGACLNRKVGASLGTERTNLAAAEASAAERQAATNPYNATHLGSTVFNAFSSGVSAANSGNYNYTAYGWLSSPTQHLQIKESNPFTLAETSTATSTTRRRAFGGTRTTVSGVDIKKWAVEVPDCPSGFPVRKNLTANGRCEAYVLYGKSGQSWNSTPSDMEFVKVSALAEEYSFGGMSAAAKMAATCGPEPTNREDCGGNRWSSYGCRESHEYTTWKNCIEQAHQTSKAARNVSSGSGYGGYYGRDSLGIAMALHDDPGKTYLVCDLDWETIKAAAPAGFNSVYYVTPDNNDYNSYGSKFVNIDSMINRPAYQVQQSNDEWTYASYGAAKLDSSFQCCVE